MLKLLIKKQMTEVFRSYFYDAKKGKARTKGSSILFFALFFLLMVGVIGGMVTMLCVSICGSLAAANVGWLYFLILGMIAVLFGTLGSVFNTFSTLYLAKDNDLLFSLPIPPRTVMTARLMTVLLLSLMYTLVVSLPAVIVYWCMARVTVMTVVGGLVWSAMISLFVLALSCALGWVVARISLRLKNRSILTVLIALVCLGLYYFVYFKAQSLVRKLVENAVIYGEKIRGAAYSLYIFGRAGEGGWWELLVFSGVVLALLALCIWLISKSFMKIVTATSAAPKAKYREKTAKQRSAFGALLHKEVARFTSSSVYMLNCGLGLLFIPAIGIFLLILGEDTVTMLEGFLWERPGSLAVIFCAAFTFCLSMVDTTAPSVSLEGKNLWVSRSLPVPTWKILRAKLILQLRLSLLPSLFTAVVAAVMIHGNVALKVLTVLVCLLNVQLFALFGLFAGIRFANLQWTSEMIPVKQGAAVTMTILGGFGVAAVLAGLYFLTGWRIGAVSYLGLCMVLQLALCVLLYFWLKKIGVERFEAL